MVLFFCGLPMYSIRQLRFRNEVKLNVYQMNINEVPSINYMLIILSLFYSKGKLCSKGLKNL